MENKSLAICLGRRTLVNNDVKICLRHNRVARLETWTTLHFANTFEKYVWVIEKQIRWKNISRMVFSSKNLKGWGVCNAYKCK